jgi:hypothetical protein
VIYLNDLSNLQQDQLEAVLHQGSVRRPGEHVGQSAGMQPLDDAQRDVDDQHDDGEEQRHGGDEAAHVLGHWLFDHLL